jgi:hypothetical protein
VPQLKAEWPPPGFLLYVFISLRLIPFIFSMTRLDSNGNEAKSASQRYMTGTGRQQASDATRQRLREGRRTTQRGN